MKIRTKLAIFVVAAIISLTGFGLITNGLSASKIMTATTPGVQFSVSVTG
ncbi:MAG: hypothetical protein MUP71_13470 [Candidatus Aminicenantes bacterium]|nr:hypothetical protein [Candidatus Aminicenantes bacterium]MCJ7526214.1 hypothetical protein [Candidatus Aminicenantes bacterium]